MGLMGDVINFPPKSMRLHRQKCNDCNSILEYWLGDDDCAYGICIGCLDLIPTEIEYIDNLLEEE
jgi:hypothetical protein